MKDTTLKKVPEGECEICGYYGPALRCVHYLSRGCTNARCFFCTNNEAATKHMDKLPTVRFVCETCTANPPDKRKADADYKPSRTRLKAASESKAESLEDEDDVHLGLRQQQHQQQHQQQQAQLKQRQHVQLKRRHSESGEPELPSDEDLPLGQRQQQVLQQQKVVLKQLPPKASSEAPRAPKRPSADGGRERQEGAEEQRAKKRKQEPPADRNEQPAKQPVVGRTTSQLGHDGSPPAAGASASVAAGQQKQPPQAQLQQHEPQQWHQQQQQQPQQQLRHQQDQQQGHTPGGDDVADDDAEQQDKHALSPTQRNPQQKLPSAGAKRPQLEEQRKQLDAMRLPDPGRPAKQHAVVAAAKPQAPSKAAPADTAVTKRPKDSMQQVQPTTNDVPAAAPIKRAKSPPLARQDSSLKAAKGTALAPAPAPKASTAAAKAKAAAAAKASAAAAKPPAAASKPSLPPKPHTAKRTGSLTGAATANNASSTAATAEARRPAAPAMPGGPMAPVPVVDDAMRRAALQMLEAQRRQQLAREARERRAEALRQKHAQEQAVERANPLQRLMHGMEAEKQLIHQHEVEVSEEEDEEDEQHEEPTAQPAPPQLLVDAGVLQRAPSSEGVLSMGPIWIGVIQVTYYQKRMIKQDVQFEARTVTGCEGPTTDLEQSIRRWNGSIVATAFPWRRFCDSMPLGHVYKPTSTVAFHERLSFSSRTHAIAPIIRHLLENREVLEVGSGSNTLYLGLQQRQDAPSIDSAKLSSGDWPFGDSISHVEQHLVMLESAPRESLVRAWSAGARPAKSSMKGVGDGGLETGGLGVALAGGLTSNMPPPLMATAGFGIGMDVDLMDVEDQDAGIRSPIDAAPPSTSPAADMHAESPFMGEAASFEYDAHVSGAGMDDGLHGSFASHGAHDPLAEYGGWDDHADVHSPMDGDAGGFNGNGKGEGAESRGTQHLGFPVVHGAGTAASLGMQPPSTEQRNGLGPSAAQTAMQQQPTSTALPTMASSAQLPPPLPTSAMPTARPPPHLALHMPPPPHVMQPGTIGHEGGPHSPFPPSPYAATTPASLGVSEGDQLTFDLGDVQLPFIAQALAEQIAPTAGPVIAGHANSGAPAQRLALPLDPRRQPGQGARHNHPSPRDSVPTHDQRHTSHLPQRRASDSGRAQQESDAAAHQHGNAAHSRGGSHKAADIRRSALPRGHGSGDRYQHIDRTHTNGREHSGSYSRHNGGSLPRQHSTSSQQRHGDSHGYKEKSPQHHGSGQSPRSGGGLLRSDSNGYHKHHGSSSIAEEKHRGGSHKGSGGHRSPPRHNGPAKEKEQHRSGDTDERPRKLLWKAHGGN